MQWDDLIAEEGKKNYFIKLRKFLVDEYRTYTVYPKKEEIMNALYLTKFDDVKVVILGQDPYHGANQAHGLSFSVQPGVAIPPSLVNIYKELESDLGYTPVQHGCLQSWADQGVLLLNTVLTVRANQANSHRGHGWEQFTDEIIMELNNHPSSIVYILWGAQARQKKQLINQEKHFIIEAPHPSPLSSYRGFFGSKPFSKANEYLIRVEREPINWQLPESVTD